MSVAPWRYRLGTTAAFIELGDVETPSPGDPLYGVVRGSLDASEPGRLAMDVLVHAATPDALETAVEAITGWLRLAQRTAALDIGSWVSFHVQRRVTTGVRYYDVTGGSFQPGTPDVTGTTVIGRLTLRCTRNPRGAAITPSISGARAYGGTPWLVENIPGDVDALCRFDFTLSTGLARLRLARRSGDGIGTSDWNPWVDLTTVTGSTSQAEAAAYGGTYIQRSISGASWLELADASLAAGPYNRGRMDLWLRMRDNATAMAAPTALTATPTPGQASISSRTITADTPVTTSVTTFSTPGIRSGSPKVATQTGLTGNTQAIAVTPSPATTANNTLVAVIGLRATSAGTVDNNYAATSTPAGWVHVRTIHQGTGLTRCALMYYVRPNSSSLSGSQSWTIARNSPGTGNQNWEMRLWFGEIENVPGESLDAFTMTSGAGAAGGVASASFTTSFSIAAVEVGSGSPTLIFGGFNEATNGQGLLVATALKTDTNSISYSAPLGADNVSGVLVLRPTVGSTPGTETPSSNPPGRLNTGNYTIYAQAIDEFGNYGLRSAVVANSTATVTVANSSVAWGWGAVSGAVEYRVVVEHGSSYYEWFTPTDAFTLTDLASGTQVGKAPSAVTVAARVQAVDISGNRSNATATTTSTNTVSNTNAAITYAWTAPTGTPQIAYYVITLQLPGSVFRSFNTTDASTSFTIRDLKAGTLVTALPATSGATASRNYVRAKVGNATYGPVQAPVAGGWYNVHVATTDLLERLFDGASLTLPIVIEAVSGGGPAANVDVDAIWAVPHDEPQVTVRTADLTTLTSTWTVESDRRGAGSIAYRTSSGTPTAPLSSQGVFTLAPGDSLVSALTEGSGGVSSITPTLTPATLTVWPRWHWSAP